MQGSVSPLEVAGLWHPLLVLGKGQAKNTRVQANDLALGCARPGTLLLMGAS